MENVDVKQVRKRGRKSICNPYFEEISNLLNMGVSIASAHKIIIATKKALFSAYFCLYLI